MIRHYIFLAPLISVLSVFHLQASDIEIDDFEPQTSSSIELEIPLLLHDKKVDDGVPKSYATTQSILYLQASDIELNYVASVTKIVFRLQIHKSVIESVIKSGIESAIDGDPINEFKFRMQASDGEVAVDKPNGYTFTQIVLTLELFQKLRELRDESKVIPWAHNSLIAQLGRLGAIASLALLPEDRLKRLLEDYLCIFTATMFDSDLQQVGFHLCECSDEIFHCILDRSGDLFSKDTTNVRRLTYINWLSRLPEDVSKELLSNLPSFELDEDERKEEIYSRIVGAIGLDW